MISLLRARSQVPSQSDEYSIYDEDFESTVTSKTQLTSEHSSSGTLISDTSQSTNKNQSSPNLSSTKPTILSESGSSVSSSAHTEKRLLDRSNVHQQPFTSQLKQDPAGLLSAIQPHHTPNASARLDKDKENLSTHSSLEDSDRRLSLTPIHTKGLVPAQHKGHLLQVKRHSLDSVTLSPIHKPEKVDDEMTICQSRKSPSTPPLSPVREPLIVTQLPAVSSTQQHTVVPPLKTNVSSSSESYEQLDNKLPLDASVTIDKSLLLNDSMVTEFNELQDALKAAGLPQIADRKSPPIMDEPNVVSIQRDAMSPIPQDWAISPTPDLAVTQKLTNEHSIHGDTKSQAKDDKWQNSERDSPRSEPLEAQSGENYEKLRSAVTIPQQRPPREQSVEPRPLATTTATSKRNALREALRVIAGEELTSLSKGILYEEGRDKSDTHSGGIDRPDETEHNEILSLNSSNSPSPLNVPVVTVDRRENTLSDISSKPAIRIPTGSLTHSSQLEEELADILSPKDDPFTSETDDTQIQKSNRPQKQTQRKPPLKDRQSNIGSVRQPFQVSSRLYPGPKAPPKAPPKTARQGHRTQKSSMGVPPPKKIKRVARQKSLPLDTDTSCPAEIQFVRQSPSVELVARRGCTQCDVERAESEHWKKAWLEEKVRTCT